MKRLILLFTLAFVVLLGIALYLVTTNAQPATAEDMDALNRARDLAIAEPLLALILFALPYWYLAGRRRDDLTPGILLVFSIVFSLVLTIGLFYLLMERAFSGERGQHLPAEGIWTAVKASVPLLLPLIIVMWVWNRIRTSRLLAKG